MEDQLIEKIKKFEKKFNEEEISDIEVEYLGEDEDYYYANTKIYFKNSYIEIIEECQYPKKLIDFF